MARRSRRLRLLAFAAAIAIAVPWAARADTASPSVSSTAAGVTVVRTGPLTVMVHHSPFSIEVIQAGRVVLRSASDALGASASGAVTPLGFALGPEVRAQTPEASYGVFASAEHWIGSTSVTSVRNGHLQVGTQDPSRTFDVTVHKVAQGVVDIDAVLSGSAGVAATGAAFQRGPDERFLGFGERSDHVDQTGHTVEGWNEEGPFSAGALRPVTDPVMGESWQGPPPFGPASNFTMPWFVARSGYGFLLHSTWLNRIHLDEPGTWRVEHANPKRLTMRLYGGPTPADVLQRFTADRDVGRQPPPASWYFGPWYQPNGDDAFQKSLLARWRQLHVPLTVAMTYTHYLPCAAQNGHDKQEQAQTDLYHQWGYKVTTYVNSFVCQDHPQGAYQAGDAHGWFIKTVAGTTYPVPYLSYRNSSSAVVDFTAPGATRFWQNLITPALVNGYDGWMEDFGEYVPPDAVLADGRSGVEAHNDYCTQYHRASHDLTWNRMHRAAFAQFVRCGSTGTAPVARIVWGGDPTEDDSEADGLAAAVNEGLSMGLSGISYWGSDIGGFHAIFTAGRTSPELLVRWIEFGAFSGIMRTEADGYGRPDQTNPPKAEVWDPDVLPYWRRMTRLRTQLFPYIWAAAQEYQRNGTPIMRALALAYPNAPEAWGVGANANAARFEFMFGPDVLAAPVVDMGATSRDVWLPPGQWVDFWDLFSADPSSGVITPKAAAPAVIDGNRAVHVAAPLDRIPLYVRAGACVPILPGDVDSLITDTGFQHDAEVVTLADRPNSVRRVPTPGAHC